MIFIKAQLKNSDDQTNIDKYTVAANITEYHTITKLKDLTVSYGRTDGRTDLNCKKNFVF